MEEEIYIDIWKSRKCDIDIIKYIYESYENKDISSEITKNMQMVILPNEIDYEKVDNYLKAIRQDLKKNFLAIENIEKIYKEKRKNISNI